MMKHDRDSAGLAAFPDVEHSVVGEPKQATEDLILHGIEDSPCARGRCRCRWPSLNNGIDPPWTRTTTDTRWHAARSWQRTQFGTNGRNADGRAFAPTAAVACVSSARRAA